MKNQLMTILLIEDDVIACKELKDYIETSEGLTLLGVTSDSNAGIEMVQSLLPDVIILDIELHHGTGNGIMFLAGLNNLPLSRRPYILVTTNNSSNVTYESARQLGADFIMGKYKADYSAQYVVEFLRMIQHTILSSRRETAPQLDTVESREQQQKMLLKRVHRDLDLIGISPKNIGYKYLTDAILMTIENPTANLSRQIAEKYKKSDASIERAMQNAINRAWRMSDIEELLSLYTAKIHSEKGVPTILEFVHYYANKIKTDL